MSATPPLGFFAAYPLLQDRSWRHPFLEPL